MVNIRSNVHKKSCNLWQRYEADSISLYATNKWAHVRGESRVIVRFLCISSDYALYFKVWPWRSLTELVITINSAYHLGIRKLKKKLSLVKKIWRRHVKKDDRWIYDGQTDRRTDSQTARQTNGKHNNYIILPVFRWTRVMNALWRLFLEAVTRWLWQIIKYGMDTKNKRTTRRTDNVRT